MPDEVMYLIPRDLLLEIKEFLCFEPGWSCGNDKLGRQIRRREIKLGKEHRKDLYVALTVAIQYGEGFHDEEVYRAKLREEYWNSQNLPKVVPPVDEIQAEIDRRRAAGDK